MNGLKGFAKSVFLIFLWLMPTPGRAELSPAAVGWGNLLVPGLGATLRGMPGRGLIEASTEIGTYYGGTFGTQEGQFTIDGSVSIPTAGNLYNSLTGQVLQEFGLKLHFYDTFYHYQQSALAVADSDREKNNPQPLYTGDWSDVLTAPFKWKNLSNIWVYPLLIASTAYLFYSYGTTAVAPVSVSTQPAAESLYGFTQVAVIPLGSSFGEEVLFRGMIQREIHLYTRSLPVAILTESSLFALIHPPELRAYAFLGGIYYGIAVQALGGDLEPGIASHFWIDVVNGLVTYWTFRRAQGKDTPFMPPVGTQISIPF